MKYITFLFIFFCTSISYSQNTQIYGIILNDENQPIDNAIIGYEKSTLSSNSNPEGRFEIPESPLKNDILIVNKVGYETQSLSISTLKKPVEITLEKKYQTIPEVVITPLNAKAILDSILVNVERNYERKIFYTGTYKEGNFNNQKLTKYAQALLQFEINKDTKNKLYIESHNSFKKQDSSAVFFNLGLSKLMNEGLEITKLINYLKNNLGKYSYLKAHKNIFGERPVIEVFLKEQESDNFYREIIIDAENYAVLRYSNHLNATNKIPTKKGDYFQQTNSLQIDYRPSNGKYILNKIKVILAGNYVENTTSIPINSYMEFAVTDYCLFDCKTLKKAVDIKKSIYEQINSKNKSIPNNNIQNAAEYNYIRQ